MLLTFSAWIVSVLGFALAYVIAFANSMKTVPSKSIGSTIASAVLPLLAVALSAWVIARYWSEQRHGAALGLGGFPLLIALIGVLVAFMPLTSSKRSSKAWKHDTATRPDGTTYFRDTPHNWSLDEPAYRSTVAREVAGAEPPQNAATWSAYWAEHFAALRRWHENPQRHIDFIAQLRREAKLPELLVPAPQAG